MINILLPVELKISHEHIQNKTRQFFNLALKAGLKSITYFDDTKMG